MPISVHNPAQYLASDDMNFAQQRYYEYQAMRSYGGDPQCEPHQYVHHINQHVHQQASESHQPQQPAQKSGLLKSIKRKHNMKQHLKDNKINEAESRTVNPQLTRSQSRSMQNLNENQNEYTYVNKTSNEKFTFKQLHSSFLIQPSNDKVKDETDCSRNTEENFPETQLNNSANYINSSQVKHILNKQSYVSTNSTRVSGSSITKPSLAWPQINSSPIILQNQLPIANSAANTSNQIMLTSSASCSSSSPSSSSSNSPTISTAHSLLNYPMFGKNTSTISPTSFSLSSESTSTSSSSSAYLAEEAKKTLIHQELHSRLSSARSSINEEPKSQCEIKRDVKDFDHLLLKKQLETESQSEQYLLNKRLDTLNIDSLKYESMENYEKAFECCKESIEMLDQFILKLHNSLAATEVSSPSIFVNKKKAEIQNLTKKRNNICIRAKMLNKKVQSLKSNINLLIEAKLTNNVHQQPIYDNNANVPLSSFGKPMKTANGEIASASSSHLTGDAQKKTYSPILKIKSNLSDRRSSTNKKSVKFNNNISLITTVDDYDEAYDEHLIDRLLKTSLNTVNIVTTLPLAPEFNQVNLNTNEQFQVSDKCELCLQSLISHELNDKYCNNCYFYMKSNFQLQI